jgi:DNA-directed RNA polymerase specialized sigma24 family protein
VRTGISELPELERQVILLGYGQDLSQSQIAERLEWPIGTVKSRTRRAMAQLRSRLGATVDADDMPAAFAVGVATETADDLVDAPAWGGDR